MFSFFFHCWLLAYKIFKLIPTIRNYLLFMFQLHLLTHAVETVKFIAIASNQYSVVTRKSKLTIRFIIHVFSHFKSRSYAVKKNIRRSVWFSENGSLWLCYSSSLSSSFVIEFSIRFHNHINDFLFRIDYFFSFGSAVHAFKIPY